ncbi:MAG: hypothetical protein E7345_03045 [Clostridiales bacterium]|nr:hypothetical protein [Clostridiales bacterium]
METTTKQTNRNFEPIIGTPYLLHIKRKGDLQTGHEKIIDYIYKKQGLPVESKTTDGITGIYLGALYQEKKNENGYYYEQMTEHDYVITDTDFKGDKYGNFLLKSYFSHLHDAKKIKTEHKDIGSTIVIPSQEYIRVFNNDTIIYEETNGLYPIKIYDDKEKDIEKKFKYNFLNINGEQIRDEHFSPVGSGGEPIIEAVQKPFYKVIDNKTITDTTITGGANIYPTSYVYRDEHDVVAFPNSASLLISNAKYGYPAISDPTPYIQDMREREEQMDLIYRTVSEGIAFGILDEKTQTALLNILNQEMDMINEYDKLPTQGL